MSETQVTQEEVRTTEEQSVQSKAEFNTTTEIQPFGLVERVNNFIYFPDSPRVWRADCKAGIFKIGSDTIKSNTLQMKVLGIKADMLEILGYPCQQWVELAFIDEDECVSSIFIKGISIEALTEVMRTMTIEQKNLTEMILTASMNKKSGEKGDYYSLSFTTTPNTDEDEIERLKDFAQNYPLKSRLNEMIKLNQN
jgi:hypothetical protein